MGHEAVAMPVYIPIFGIDLAVGFLRMGMRVFI
jgi:hypothetical protein